MFSRRKKIDQRLAAIRAAWGKEKTSYIPIESVRIYFDLKPERDDFQVLTNRIVNDLDLDRVFQVVDRTNSRVGQQYLYDQLRRPTNDRNRLQSLEQQITFFEQGKADRETAQQLLSDLNTVNDFYLARLIYDTLPEKPWWLRWVHLLQGVSIGGLVLCLFYPSYFLAFLAVLPINLFLHYRNKNHIGKFLVTFSRFGKFYQTGAKLRPFMHRPKSELDTHFRHLKHIFRKVGFIRLDNLQEQEPLAPIWFLAEVLKFITLSELILFYKLLDEIKGCRNSIQYIFEAIGAIDLAISVASLRAGLPYYAQPEFPSGPKRIQMHNALHPLLLEGVANDLELADKSMLLTGSNMSGKTTFIRTVGLNVILAQTILTPFCRTYRAPFLRLGTSIRITDDVEEDKSYYLEEVNVIGSLIEASTGAEPYLFIIDEMFKGTNTVERVSAAKAVLSYLNRGSGYVLISTHDIELTDYLQDSFELYYFQESVENHQLTFDYRIKKGRLQQRNAIKILEIMGYPESIIAEANQLAGRIKKS